MTDSKSVVVQLSPARFQAAEYKRNIWDVIVEPHVTLEQMNKPEFWAHIAAKLKVRDRIEVSWDDGSHLAEFYVISSGTNWATVHTLYYNDLGKQEKIIPDDPYEVRWAGPHSLFRVVRKADDAVIQEKLPNRDAAVTWMREYMKTIKAA